jgi:hypothetical protein
MRQEPRSAAAAAAARRTLARCGPPLPLPLRPTSAQLSRPPVLLLAVQSLLLAAQVSVSARTEGTLLLASVLSVVGRLIGGHKCAGSEARAPLHHAGAACGTTDGRTGRAAACAAPSGVKEIGVLYAVPGNVMRWLRFRGVFLMRTVH